MRRVAHATVPGRTDHVVVVGAGLSGLSTALHLLGAGRAVTVLEREPHPGGRTGRLDVDGFRIDTGPTVMTMPELVDDALAAVGSSLAERLELTKLDPAYHARFADGSTLDVHTDPEAMETEIRRLAGPQEALGYRRLRAWLTELYQAEFDRFVASNFDSPLDLLHPSLAKVAALGAFGRLDNAIGRFVRDERVRRVFSFQALYAGLPPQQALAAYAVIPYMDTIRGVYAVRGGLRQLPQALADAATEAGAKFRYDTTVAGLERAGSRVTAVRTAAGERIPCDAVVLTTDLPVSYRLLGRAPRRPVGLRWSPSAVVLHLASDRRAENFPHHTISFGAAWRGTFREIIRDGRLMSDPSLLVTTPTGVDPALAPAGRHLHYVLAPCPNLQAGPLDWARLTPAYVDELRDVLAARGLPAADGELLHVTTPLDWAAQGHAAGTPFSAAHTFAQTGPFRPRNLVRGTENAVLAGSGTTPGVGIPTTLVSGRLAAARITGR
ncbi:phytoene desaturase family protein [Streptoalloteichus hindustanus]|uniref:Phytoene desaturase n=1 Tax=Streptoalloteichus hindustanus TaxID=2017 RepID=A0A1M5BBX0_STRHI|nr:phytoene desaturase family protein [Streptoalloteichus hindustanus]SHF40023.1 phytoene desaturase [Streptoalloteichus hindustanus]